MWHNQFFIQKEIRFAWRARAWRWERKNSIQNNQFDDEFFFPPVFSFINDIQCSHNCLFVHIRMWKLIKFSQLFQLIVKCERLPTTFYWIWALLTYWCLHWTVCSILFICWIRIGHLVVSIVASTILWEMWPLQHQFLLLLQYHSIGKFKFIHFISFE